MERRLAAILVADMAGYSRLMEQDEEDVLTRQKTHRRELIDPEIAGRGGRIVKTTGDGMLAEFASAQDAVRCAIDIQTAMAERESAEPDGSADHISRWDQPWRRHFRRRGCFRRRRERRLASSRTLGAWRRMYIRHRSPISRGSVPRAFPRHGQAAREEHLPAHSGLAVDARCAGGCAGSG